MFIILLHVYFFHFMYNSFIKDDSKSFDSFLFEHELYFVDHT